MKHKPEQIDGKSSVTNLTIHMHNYLEDVSNRESFLLVISYHTGAAHERWIVFKDSKDEEQVEL